MGIPTHYTILGNKVAPWLAERYLARTAVDGHQMDRPPDKLIRAGNIFEPDAGDPGARGRFDDLAHAHSPQWWATRHRRALGISGAALAGAGAAYATRCA